jgi:hypothetical protein
MSKLPGKPWSPQRHAVARMRHALRDLKAARTILPEGDPYLSFLDLAVDLLERAGIEPAVKRPRLEWTVARDRILRLRV